MKKNLLVFAVVLFVFCLGACSSGPASQEDINNAFERIYSKYRADLILDGAEEYTIVSGDTLSRLSINRWGSGNGFYFPVIMMASRDVVADPDFIQPGMKVTIPNLQKNLDDAKARSRIKAFLKEISDVYKKKGDEGVQNELIKLSNSL